MLDPYTSFYFYSAVLQGNAALIALTATFLMFKKQQLDNRFNELSNMISNYIRNLFGNVSFFYKSIFYLENIPEDHLSRLDPDGIKKYKEFKNSDLCNKTFEEMKKIEQEKKDLWNKGSAASYNIFAVLMSSLIFLATSSIIRQYLWLEWTLLIITALAEIYGLFYLMQFYELTIKEK